jgi:hypothetical protein
MSLYEECLVLSLDWDSTEDIVRGCVEHVSKAKDAEIERWRQECGRKDAIIELQKIHCEGQSAQIDRLKALITELADALRAHYYRPSTWALVQRAREATR